MHLNVNAVEREALHKDIIWNNAIQAKASIGTQSKWANWEGGSITFKWAVIHLRLSVQKKQSMFWCISRHAASMQTISTSLSSIWKWLQILYWKKRNILELYPEPHGVKFTISVTRVFSLYITVFKCLINVHCWMSH